MSDLSKKEHIRRNLELPDEELARQTGWNPRKVRRYKERLKESATSPSRTAQPHGQKGPFHFWAWGWTALAVTLVFYYPVLSCHFLNWDDSDIIFENIRLSHLDLGFLHWAFTTFKGGNWMPLVWVSLALDYRIAGPSSLVYHLDNLLLHGVNTLLVFILSAQVFRAWAGARNAPAEGEGSGWQAPAACLAALLFGLHPLHVESVAWATERKDVLYGMFYLASLCAYVAYATSVRHRSLQYGLSLALFAASLASKPMAITLPVVLVLLDVWPLGRWTREKGGSLADKIPFFLGSLALGLIALKAQGQAEAISSMEKLPLDLRLLNTFHSTLFYIVKIFVPWNLAAYYPLPYAAEAYSAEYLASAGVVLLIMGGAWHFRRSKPFLAASLAYYLATLAPVIGILQVGTQASADRYTYLPLLGFFMVLSGWVCSRYWKGNWPDWLVLALFTLGLGFLTVRQLGFWKDSVALWENVRRVDAHETEVLFANLGNAYHADHRYPEALEAYDKAIALGPPESTPHEGKAIVLFDMGRIPEALEEFKKAIVMDPSKLDLHQDLWIAYNRMGQYEGALAEAQEMVRLAPDSPEGYDKLAVTYGSKGLFDESIEASQKALALYPNSPQYLTNLATTYQRAGRYDEAIQVYLRTIQMDPYSSTSFFNLGNTYMLAKRYPEAIEALERAQALQPDNASIRQKLALAYQLGGQKGGNP